MVKSQVKGVVVEKLTVEQKNFVDLHFGKLDLNEFFALKVLTPSGSGSPKLKT
jgi:hypothetical protein